MELHSPVSRLRLAGLALLVGAVAALASCNRPTDKPPEVQGGKKPVAAEPAKTAKVEGFALASARAEQHDGQLALALEFSQALVGTQAFDTLIAVTDPKGAAVEGSWSLDEDGTTLEARPRKGTSAS